jgi:hypothetical protein
MLNLAEIYGEWTLARKSQRRLCWLELMSATRVDKVSLDSVQPMIHIYASTIPNQALKIRKVRKLSQALYSKSISPAHSLFTENTIIIPCQTKFSSTETVSVIQ